MAVELITERDDLIVRRMRLAPGEAMFWHTDQCHRMTVVVHGSRLALEFRDSSEVIEIDAPDGLVDWDAPENRVHRTINIGHSIYEEVVTFYRDSADLEPQPRC